MTVGELIDGLKNFNRSYIVIVQYGKNELGNSKEANCVMEEFLFKNQSGYYIEPFMEEEKESSKTVVNITC